MKRFCILNSIPILLFIAASLVAQEKPQADSIHVALQKRYLARIDTLEQMRRTMSEQYRQSDLALQAQIFELRRMADELKPKPDSSKTGKTSQ